MRLFGFVGAPFRFIERVTGERASRQKAAGAAEQIAEHRNRLNQANAKAAEQQKRLQAMLDEITGLDRQRQSLGKDYKNKLKSLEYEEQNLKGLGEHYTKVTQSIQAKGSELLQHKSQLEERGVKLQERSLPLEQKLKEVMEEGKKIDDTEIRNLSGQFQQKYAAAEAAKEKLKSASRETSPELFSKHQKLVKELKGLRISTEEAIKAKHAGLSETHQKVAAELSALQKDYQDMESEQRDIQRGQEKLARKKKYIDTYQGILEPELKKFATMQEAFKEKTRSLKVFQQKFDHLEQGYIAKKGEAETLQKELKDTGAWQEQLVNRLKGLQQDFESHAQRYQERAGRTGMIKAGLAALGTMWGGGALGLGSGATNLAAGLGAFAALNNMKNDVQKNLQKFGAYTDFAADSYKAGGIPDWNKTPLNRVEFKSRVFDTKVKMPEFGGLAQSIKHFEMPTLPKLAELPALSEALGKIKSLEDIANLGILPGSTNRSPNRSLLNPQLMQTFHALMKSKGRNPGERPANKNRKGSLKGMPLPRGGYHYGH